MGQVGENYVAIFGWRAQYGLSKLQIAYITRSPFQQLLQEGHRRRVVNAFLERFVDRRYAPRNNWCRDPTGRTRGEYDNLMQLIGGFSPGSNSSDSWRWVMSTNGIFTTKKLNNIIMEKVFEGEKSQPETSRKPLIPKKMEIFIWRARKKRLPTLCELDKRGIDLHSVRCSICDDDVENIDHALIFCKCAYDVWSRIYNWWNLGPYVNTSIAETFAGSVNQNMSKIGAKLWQAVEWTCGYLIWKNRNSKVFKNKSLCVASLVNEIQVLSFDWNSKRLKGPKIDWCSWLANPHQYLFIT
ncbi:uncharacterized protein [Rutidosis leptorrhynchoides]|uniref:uncharacterized protein n=1 Tax=Rutidosis leptorrhynchoides TaxID=125765 RepID=UPI003A99FD8F